MEMRKYPLLENKLQLFIQSNNILYSSDVSLIADSFIKNYSQVVPSTEIDTVWAQLFIIGVFNVLSMWIKSIKANKNEVSSLGN